MDANTLWTGVAAGIAMGATFLGGARYIVRAELNAFTVNFKKELNGEYVRAGECKIVQKLREEQFKYIDERLESEGG